jgi:hypothetical protein
MPLAVTVRFDPDTEALLMNMRGSLAFADINSESQRSGYGAHLSLAIYPDEYHANSLKKALRNATRVWRALPVTIAALGIFPASSTL